jgi:hypothetical protein
MVQHWRGHGEGRASHRVLDGLGRYSGGITAGEAASCFGKTNRSMLAVPSGGEDGMQARQSRRCHTPERRLVWTRGTMA